MTSQNKQAQPALDTKELKIRLQGRPIVLVGMMGAGKTSVGRRLANLLDWTFLDSDTEIETAADMEIAEIFALHGEDYFRSGEARVIARLLNDDRRVLATGGGAFINGDTRALIKSKAISIFIHADLDLLFERVSRRSNRPLLKTPDPKGTLADLISKRYPVYELADIKVNSRDVPQDVMAQEIALKLLDALPKPNPAHSDPAQKVTSHE